MYHALYEEMNWESLFEKKIKPPYIPEIMYFNKISLKMKNIINL